MEIIFLVLVVIFALAILPLLLKRYTIKQKLPTRYLYKQKQSLVTASELVFFQRLENIVREKYYIFPQVHLSSLLNHEVPGQDWRAALAVIQRKSVDYVLANKATLKPVYVIELDDYSHDAPVRQKRDELVERLLTSVKLPLVRFRDINRISDEDIINALADAATQNAQNSAG